MAESKRKRPAKGAGKGRKKKGNIVEADFEGVESGGGRAIPDGTYKFEVNKVTTEESEASGNDYLAWRWKGLTGAAKGATVFDNTSLQPQALWRLRGLLECMGIEVPDGPMEIDIDGLVGEVICLEILNEEYEGKDKPRVTGFSPEDALADDEPEDEESEDDDEEEEAPKKKSKSKSKKKSKKSKKKDDEEDEDEDDEDDDEFRIGMKVKFKNDKGKMTKGVIEAIDDDEYTVVTSDDEEWELELDELKKA